MRCECVIDVCRVLRVWASSFGFRGCVNKQPFGDDFCFSFTFLLIEIGPRSTGLLPPYLTYEPDCVYAQTVHQVHVIAQNLHKLPENIACRC